jgi:hypothetical protein
VCLDASQPAVETFVKLNSTPLESLICIDLSLSIGLIDIIPDAGLPILCVSLFPLLSSADLTRSRWFAEQLWKENVDGMDLDSQRS